MKYVHSLFQATVLALAVGGAGYTVAAPAATHDDDNTAWFGPNAKPYGVTFSEWTARLWQHVLSIPNGESLLLDAGFNKCSVGQSGPVWFLAGNLGGVSQRVCDVPADKALLFPVYDTFAFDTPGVCGQGAAESVQFYRNGAAAAVDGVLTLNVDLDGKSVPKLFERRYKSVVYSASLPVDNLFNPFCTESGGVPRGIYSPAIDDGYYVMLKPLPAGRHTLRIRAAAVGFELDVSYKLNVVPVVTH